MNQNSSQAQESRFRVGAKSKRSENIEYRVKFEKIARTTRKREKYRQLDGDYEDRFYR